MENEKEYNIKKWKRIMNVTQNNYANMLKRLNRQHKVSNYVLIYYSIFLIVITLTSKYFPTYFNAGLGEYFGIILSIIVLAYSLINNSANYAVRITNIEDAINKIKTIKRGLESKDLNELIDRYNAVTDTTELRSDVDFFITVKQLCKKNNMCWFTVKFKSKMDEMDYSEEQRQIKDYISELSLLVEEVKIISEYVWYAILFLIPIVIFLICILSEMEINIL